jgi:NAD(P)-dependent dehydrogenase (short-subunit alcohol dehydrogenase family)
MDLGLDGRRVLVAAGTRGIGRAIAELLAAEGARVATCARDGVEVETVAAELARSGRKAFGLAVDVSNGAPLSESVSAAAAALGGIDIVVPNVSALAVAGDEGAWRSSRTTICHNGFVNTISTLIRPRRRATACPRSGAVCAPGAPACSWAWWRGWPLFC